MNDANNRDNQTAPIRTNQVQTGAVLTALDEEANVVVGLDLGADDYMPNRSGPKNFYPE